MALPKFSDLTANIPGVFDKMKSFVDSIAGSSKTAATEEALSNESDPLKAKLLEVELYIHQMNDVLSQQYNVLNTLKSKYAELQSLMTKETPKEQEAVQKQPEATEKVQTTVVSEGQEEKKAE